MAELVNIKIKEIEENLLHQEKIVDRLAEAVDELESRCKDLQIEIDGIKNK